MPRPTYWEDRCREFERQRRCRHLKGGLYHTTSLDHNISIHTFPTGERRIKCLNHCGFEVWDLPNWQFKWTFGMKMVKRSTNTETRSQVLYPNFGRNSGDIAVVFDSGSCSINIGDENPIRGLKENR